MLIKEHTKLQLSVLLAFILIFSTFASAFAAPASQFYDSETGRELTLSQVLEGIKDKSIKYENLYKIDGERYINLKELSDAEEQAILAYMTQSGKELSDIIESIKNGDQEVLNGLANLVAEETAKVEAKTKEDLTPLKIESVNAINGKVTVEFNKEVTELPEGLVVLKDGEALELEADAFVVVEGKVEITVPLIEATEEEQTIVYSVKLGEAKAVAAEAVVIPAREKTDVEKVEAMIEALPEVKDLTKEDISKVGEARDAYEKLSEEQKAQVKNYDKLDALLKEAEKIYNQDLANIVIEMIANLDPTSETFAESVATAREAYDGLTPEQKELVTNYDLLVAAEESLKSVTVVKVSAINGKVTVEFNKEVTEVPEGLVVLKDGEALELEADAFAVVEGKVEIAVPEIEATFEEQSIVYSVKLGDAEAVAAEAVVIPAKEVVVETVAEIEDITVEFGTALEDLELPETITLILSNEKTAEVAVTWTCEDYNGTVAGEYTFVGSYELPEGVTGEKPAATVKVVVNKVIEEVTVPTTITIVLGEEPILPKTVEVIYEDGTEGEAAVEWNLEEVDFSVVGTKAITGTVVGTELEVTITVDVKSVEDLEAAVAAVKTKAEADNQDEFNAALKAPVLNIKNIKDDYLADYKTAIADAFVVESVADIQALVDGVNAEKAAEEAAEKAAEEAAKAAQLEAIKSATTVSELRKALGMDGNEDEHPVVFDHILNTTADLNAYRTAILKADPADLEAVQTIIDEVNYAKVETAVKKAEASNKQVDVDSARATLEAVEAVHADFDTAEEGEKTFAQRIADVQDIINAANKLAEAIAAVNDAATAETILTALNSQVLGLEEESVISENAAAYFAALEALKEDEEFEGFTTVAEIQAFVNKVNADEAQALIDAVNEAEDAEGFRAALTNAKATVKVENKEAYFTAFTALKEANTDFVFKTVEEMKDFVAEIDKVEAVKAATTEDDMIAALVAVENANFINLRPAAVRTDVATLMIAYITEEDNDEMIFLADVNAVLEAQIDLAAELLGNLNAAETNTEILAALKAIQEAGFEITANLELVDSVVVAREAEGFTGFRSIQEVLALAE